MSEPGVHIERLSLRLAGLDDAAARSLARAVAAGLAAGIVPGPGSTRLPALRLELAADPAAGGGPDALAERIVQAVSRALGSAGDAAGPTTEVAP